MRRSWLLIFLLSLVFLATLPLAARAQSWPQLGGRMASRNGEWLAPVAGSVLSSSEDDHLARGSVYAWDLSVPLGTAVHPMAAGTVTYAGCNNAGGYGCWALIDHAGGYNSVYAHMLNEGDGQIRVKTGDRVNAWTTLGYVGWTGMTSFGPHVHWEIRHVTKGRLRNDLFFARSAIEYCKFCPANGKRVSGWSQVSDGSMVAYYASSIVDPPVLSSLLLLAIAIFFFFKPELAARSLEVASRLGYRFFWGSDAHLRQAWQRHRFWFSMGMIFLAPTFLCGSFSAVGVWMMDEGIKPSAVMAYWRYGLYPFTGMGYQNGAKYSAVWGLPCSNIGTIGRTCTVDGIVAAGLQWQREVGEVRGIEPIPVVIPRIAARFGVEEMRQLLNAMHYVNGLVIVDVEADVEGAYPLIDELVSYGLDGIAVDMEFIKTVKVKEMRQLAEYLALRRKEAGMTSDGVLVLWNVFHNIDQSSALQVDGIKIVPIFTGFGSAEAKMAGLSKTQSLFSAQPVDLGLMAFDNRWPINQRCQQFDTQLGFDCQDWRSLFADPEAQRLGWWVQQ